MSTKKTIYLIRHGETDYNKKGIIQGSGIDSALNTTGLDQARKFYEAYRHLSFDKVYSSRMKRAAQSVQHFVKEGVAFETLEALNELSWGVLEGQHSSPENRTVYKRMLGDWRAGLLHRKVQGGESPRQMWKRQSLGLELLMARKEEKLILLSMHARSLRSFLCLLTGRTQQQMDSFKHSNLCLYILEFKGEYFEIVESNSIDHLWY